MWEYGDVMVLLVAVALAARFALSLYAREQEG
jgi:hypothetical protein